MGRIATPPGGPYGRGESRTLVIDLDTSRGGPDAVARDAAAITTLVHRCGGRLIRDSSPNGGVHLYLPLAVPVGFHTARDLALALAARTPTMDATPNVNLPHGLIRPPGSVHKSGGHQHLAGSLAAAHHLATVGNPPTVVTALQQALAPELAALAASRTTIDTPGGLDEPAVRRPGGPRELTSAYLSIATTGVYDTDRYRSPSEARQAVLCSAAAAGMTLAQVLGRLERGTWPGLASFYTRYRHPGTRRKALLADWRHAAAFITREPPRPEGQQSLISTSPTSQPPSHRQPPGSTPLVTRRGSPAEYQHLASWWTAMLLTEKDRYGGRAGITVRTVLRAIGEAARKTGSRYVAFGARSLSVAAGLDHTTVAAHLRRLREEDDPLLVLIENDRGLAGDLYELRIPDQMALRARRVAWRPGKAHALRPAFRALGAVAALVYEALEHTRGGATTFDLIAATGLARASVHRGLDTLAAHHLAERRAGRWHHHAATSLAELAEHLGCLQEIHLILARHRAERAAYRAALRIITDPGTAGATAWEPGWWADPPPQPPPQDDETAIDLLQRALGAYVIATA